MTGDCNVSCACAGRQNGFTLLEMVLVLLLVALLASLVAPIYLRPVDQAKESALKEDLFVLRKAIDDYFADHGRYPDRLALLAEQRYVRSIPRDPIIESEDSWVVVYNDADPSRPGIIDVHSSSGQKGSDGRTYAEW